MNIILLVRSFNRPSYLERTLESLLQSDIDRCMKRYIYDDGSTDGNVIDILNNSKYISVINKEFIVIKGSENKGCQQSYTDALEYIKIDNLNNKNYYICSLDNDVIVKKTFINELRKNYLRAYNIFRTHNLLLTGFNPTNAHLNKITDYNTFYTKRTCGGINFFFHIDFIDFIIEFWKLELDHGINKQMLICKYPLCCLNKGVINHIGEEGLWSNINNCDRDKYF